MTGEEIARRLEGERARSIWEQVCQAIEEEGPDSPRARALTRWRWQPKPIMEFVEGARFLNLRGQVWTPVADTLVEATTGYRGGGYPEIILSGATGSAKSWVADLLTAYDLYCMSCMHTPQLDYGLAAHTTIAWVLQSVTREAAKKVLYTFLANVVRESPYFKRVLPFVKGLQSELRFPSMNLAIEPVASTEAAALGETVAGAVIDEANFRAIVEKSRKAPWMDVYDAAVQAFTLLSHRVRSRFLMHGTALPGKVLVVSSSRYPEDFTERLMTEAEVERRATGESMRLVVCRSRWDVAPHKYSSARFHIAAAREPTQQSRILRDGEPCPPDMDIVSPPEELRRDFELNLDEALRSIAGRPTRAVHPFLPRRDLIGAAVNPERRNPFTVEVARGLRAEDGFGVIADAFDRDTFGTPRAAHLDLAINRDAAGIAIGYVAGMIAVDRTEIEVERAKLAGRAAYLSDLEGRPVEYAPRFVIEAILAVEAKPNDEIDLVDLVGLLVRLKEDVGLPIRWVTADSFQSVAPLQMLRTRGMSTGILSVDREPEPYDELKSAIHDKRIETYQHGVLLREWASLEKHMKTGRVDHPQWAVDSAGNRVRGSKDVSDAVAGVVRTLARVRDHWQAKPSGFLETAAASIGVVAPGRASGMARPRGTRY